MNLKKYYVEDFPWWCRFCQESALPMQGTWVQVLVQEDSKPSPTATEVCMLQNLSSTIREATPQEALTRQLENKPSLAAAREIPLAATKIQDRQK